MDRDDPAYAGQRDYNRVLLNAYDPLVLGADREVRVAMPDRAALSSGIDGIFANRTSTSGPGRATSSSTPACLPGAA